MWRLDRRSPTVRSARSTNCLRPPASAGTWKDTRDPRPPLVDGRLAWDPVLKRAERRERRAPGVRLPSAWRLLVCFMGSSPRFVGDTMLRECERRLDRRATGVPSSSEVDAVDTAECPKDMRLLE